VGCSVRRGAPDLGTHDLTVRDLTARDLTGQDLTARDLTYAHDATASSGPATTPACYAEA